MVFRSSALCAALLCSLPVLSSVVDFDRAFAQNAPSSAEKQAFDAAKELGTVEAWDAFLSNFPSGFHADLARAYVKKLAEGSSGAPQGGAAPAAAGPPMAVPVPSAAAVQPDVVSVTPSIIRVGKWPERAVDDGRSLWVSESGRRSIVEINPSSGQVLSRASVERLPLDMVAANDGRVFVLNSTDNSIWVRPASGGAAKPFADIPRCASLMTYDGTSLWAMSLVDCGGKGGIVYRIAADTAQVFRVANVADGAADMKAAHGAIYISHGNSARFLTVLTPATGSIATTADPAIHFARLAADRSAVFAAGGPAGQNSGLIRKLPQGQLQFSATQQFDERIAAIVATDEIVIAVGLQRRVWILSAADLSVLRTIETPGRALDAKDAAIAAGTLFIVSSSGDETESGNAVYAIDGWLPGGTVSAPPFIAAAAGARRPVVEQQVKPQPRASSADRNAAANCRELGLTYKNGTCVAKKRVDQYRYKQQKKKGCPAGTYLNPLGVCQPNETGS